MHNDSLVFLPGWGFKASIWQSLIEALQVDMPIVLADYAHLAGTDLDSITAKIIEQIPDNSIIIAWSFGGLLALNMHKLFPDKCKKLILLAATPKFIANESWSGMKPEFATDFLAKMQQNNLLQQTYFLKLVQFPIRSSTVRDYLNAHCFNSNEHSAHLPVFFQQDLRQEYNQITIPFLHIMGDRDVITPVSEQALTNLNHQVNIKVLPGAGHIPFLTHQNDVASLIKEFIE